MVKSVKNKKKLVYALMSVSFLGFSATIFPIVNINNNIENMKQLNENTSTIANKNSKSSIQSSVTLNQDDSLFRFSYSSYVFDNIVSIFSLGNYLIQYPPSGTSRDNVMHWTWDYTTNPSSKDRYYSTAVYKSDDGKFYMRPGDAPLANNSNCPEWAYNVRYARLNKWDSSVKNSCIVKIGNPDTIVINEKVSWSWAKPSDIWNTSSHLSGVISMSVPYWRTDYDSYSWGQDTRFSQYAIASNKESYPWTWLKYYPYYDTPFGPIKDFNNHFFGSPYHYGYGWSRQDLIFAVMDGRVWFTSNGSNIESFSFDTSSVTLNDLINNKDNSEWIKSKSKIYLYNSPKFLIKNSSSDRSRIEINIDDRTQTVTFKTIIENTFVPNYNRDGYNEVPFSKMEQWVSTDNMVKSVTYNFSDFKQSPTTQILNSIDADNTINSLSPYEILADDQNRNLLTQFIYNNRNRIFSNIPEFWDQNSDGSYWIKNILRVSSTSTSITITFDAKDIYNTDNSLFTNNFTLTINLLTNKDTQISRQQWEWDASLFGIDIVAADITAENLKQFIENTPNYRELLFKNYPLDDFQIKKINLYPSNDKSKVKFGIIMNKIYRSGYVYENDYEWYYLYIINMPTTTTVKDPVNSNGINANGNLLSKAPYEVVDSDVKDFIFNNKNDIFENLPENFNDKNQITINKIDITGSTSILVNVTIPGYNAGSYEDLSFDIKINNLLNKDTNIVRNPRNWMASEFGINIPAAEINNDNLKEFIINTPNYRDLIFNQYRPEPFDLLSVNITQNTTNDIKFNITMSSLYWGGKKTTNTDDCTWYNLHIINLPTPTTVVKDNVNSNGINANGNLLSKAPFEVVSGDVQDFVFNNKSQIFDNIPVSFNEKNQLTVNNINIIDSTSISVNVTIPGYNNGNLDNLSFDIKINNLVNKDTKVKDEVAQNGIMATAPLNEISIDNISQDNRVLFDWINDNLNNIFDGYGVVQWDSNLSSINTVEKTGENEITVNVTLNNIVANGANSSTNNFTFRITNLSTEVLYTQLIKPVIIDANTLNKNNLLPSEFAQEVNNNFSSYITNEIKSNPEEYFLNLPPLNDDDLILQVGTPVVDDLNGTITVNYKLPKFYFNNVIETPNNPENNPSAFIYQATIINFKEQSNIPEFSTMKTSIDAGQLNTTVDVSSGTLEVVDAYNYKLNIKNTITKFVSDNSGLWTSSQLEAINTAMSNFDSKAVLTPSIVSTSNGIVATVNVKFDQLAIASTDNNWINGYTFTLSGATYANSEIAFGSENRNITIDEFNKLSSSEKVNSLKTSKFNHLPVDVYNDDRTDFANAFQVEASGNNNTGKGLVSITFPKFFINNNEVENYVYTFNFNFKSTNVPSNIDYITDDAIAPSTLSPDWNGKNIIEIAASINDKTVNLNDIVNTKKDQIINSDIISSYPDIQLSVPNDPSTNKPDFTISPNGDYILVNVEINNNGNKSIEQLKVGPISFVMEATNPTAVDVSSLPSDLTYENLSDKLSSIGTKNGGFITYNNGKTISNQDIVIKSAIIDSNEIINDVNNQKVVFINFIFNGVYLKKDDIKSYISDYVVKLKLVFDSSSKAISSNLVQISNNQVIKKDTNWILVISFSIFFTMLLVMYFGGRYYKKKLKKK